MSELHTIHYPNESREYREARNRLLEAEIELRRQTERVAEMRRELPIGGKLKEDYIFEELKDGKSVKAHFSELFEPGKDTLVLYSFMFHPEDENPCPMCSAMLDALNGQVRHLEQRINLAVVAKAPIEKLRRWTDKRGWNRLHLLSSYHTTYNHDYHGEDEGGDQLPNLNVYQKRADGIYHTYSTEALFAPTDTGQDARHIDPIWPLWNVLDLTPEGRGTNWYPKHEYNIKPVMIELG